MLSKSFYLHRVVPKEEMNQEYLQEVLRETKKEKKNTVSVFPNYLKETPLWRIEYKKPFIRF